MKKIIVLFLTLCFFFFSNITIAKENKTQNKKNKKEIVYSWATAPFDINIEKLPPAYKGNDIVKLYSEFIKKAPLEKGEFETTFEYEKKISSVLTAAIYAFKLDNNYLSYLKIHPYDADANKFKIKLSTDPLSYYSSEDQRASIIVKEVDSSSDSYVGSNAFGATRLVKRYEGTQYGIALVNQKNFGFGSPGYFRDGERTVNIEIGMSLDSAKKLKDNIGVLLICRPSLFKTNAEIKRGKGNDLLFEDHYYSGATIDSPTTLSFNRKFLNAEVLAIWIYDFRTGEIIQKNDFRTGEIIQKNDLSNYLVSSEDFWKDANKIYKIFNMTNQQVKSDSAILYELAFAASATAYDEFTLRYANSGYCPTDEKGFAELLNETRQMQNESDERVFCHGLKIVNAIYKFLKTSLRSAQYNEVMNAKPIITRYAETTSTVLQGMELILQKHGVQ